MTDKSDEMNKKGQLGGLVVEEDVAEDANNFTLELDSELRSTEQAVISQRNIGNVAGEARSWSMSRTYIQRFQPVPWFIWRLSNYVLGTPGHINKINEGFVMGLRRLLFAAASDATLGAGKKINDVKESLKILSADSIAAVAVIHSICRRLSNMEFERIWRPILEDAILRAHMGSMLGKYDSTFGQGRGMLAGFAGRAGLTILLSSGELEQAREALELLASGKEISEVGMKVYETNPLQVSAMLLSAAGCGRDAAFGTVSYAYKDDASKLVENKEQLKWLAAFTITEHIRSGKVDQIDPILWTSLSIKDDAVKTEILDNSKKLIRRGHGWGWLV